MACNLAIQRPCFSEGSTQLGFYGFGEELRSGEVLSGTPTVTELTTSDLTIGNIGLNSSEAEIDGVTHAANEAVTFSISGHLASNSPYTLKITVNTDSTPARTLVKYARFTVVGDPS